VCSTTTGVLGRRGLIDKYYEYWIPKKSYISLLGSLESFHMQLTPYYIHLPHRLIEHLTFFLVHTHSSPSIKPKRRWKVLRLFGVVHVILLSFGAKLNIDKAESLTFSTEGHDVSNCRAVGFRLSEALPKVNEGSLSLFWDACWLCSSFKAVNSWRIFDESYPPWFRVVGPLKNLTRVREHKILWRQRGHRRTRCRQPPAFNL